MEKGDNRVTDHDSDAGDISLSFQSLSTATIVSSTRHDISSSTPNQRFGKYAGNHASIILPPVASASTSPFVSLNDDDSVTPQAGPSTWLAGLVRPASAASNVANPVQAISTPKSKRTNPRLSSSSSLTRSRSLNVRVEADVSPSRRMASAAVRTPSGRLGWSRQPGEPRPPPLVNEDVKRRMARWVKEIVVCNFDLERGPVVERRAVNRRWGPGEKENV